MLSQERGDSDSKNGCRVLIVLVSAMGNDYRRAFFFSFSVLSRLFAMNEYNFTSKQTLHLINFKCM